MSLKLVFVGVLVGMVCAMEKPCCFSKKFNGKMKIVTVTLKNGSSIPVVTDNRIFVDYDYDQKKQSVMGTIYTDDGSQQTATNYSVLVDYKQMKSYKLYSGSDMCHVEMPDDDEMAPHCLYSEVQWVASYRMGSGSESAMVNQWDGMKDNFYVTMFTTVNDCTPVAMTRVGMTDDGDRVSESVLYADFNQYQISSDDAFKIPDICMTVGAPVGK